MAPTHESARPHRRRRGPAFRPAREELETRIVLSHLGASSVPSTTAIPAGTTALLAASPAGGSESPIGYTPQQVRTAYGFDRIQFGSVAGDGAGQTIAIVDAYDDPGLVNSSSAGFSTSDLAMFDRQFGLPDPPSFTKVSEAGRTSPLPATDPAGAGNPGSNWEYEEAMDVEWAHALAPGASIVLVEANSTGGGDLDAALNSADQLPGVSVVSMSWGDPEYGSETASDAFLHTPFGHQGVTFVASSGDGGSPGLYPAYSPDVLAIGGTTLQLNADGSIQSETAWSGSGGGASAYEPEPSWQQAVQDTGHRTIPDVAFDASPSTGVAVYDSYDNTGSGPWVSMWGTSLGAPSWSALIAVANQGRVAAGGTTLDGPSQTLPAIYSLPSTDFRDITSGGNGRYNAGPGYDEATGLGTPVANLLAPDLAFYGMSDHLVITASPGSSVVAGGPFGLTVAVEMPDGSVDPSASGTLTLSLAGAPGGASLGGTLTATIDDGVATFAGLALDQVGSGYTLAVSGGGYGSPSSSAFTVTPGAASQLAIAAEPPSSIKAGGSFGLTVDVEDAFGNLVTDNPPSVMLALAGGPAGSGLDGTMSVPATGGVASFWGLSIDQAGTDYTIQISAQGLAPMTTVAIAITAAAPAQLIIESGPPWSVTAGDGFGLTVAVQDAYGNVEPGFNGSMAVGLSGGPSGSVLGGTLTQSAVGGVATFPGLDLTEAGSGYALTVSGTGLGPVTTSSFTVTPAAASQLAIATPPPRSATAGSGFGLTIEAEDAFGNPAPGESGAVTLALAGGPGGATLLGGLQAGLAGGAATFSGLSIDQAGTGYSIQATAAGLTTAASGSFDVTPAAPSQLVIGAGPPSSLAAGAGFGLSVSVEDAYGNVATGYNGEVTLALGGGPAGAVLEGPTSEPASGGLATFSGLDLTEAGTDYAIAVADGNLAATQSSAFDVTPAAPAQLVVTQQPPQSVAAGSSFGMGVSVEDAYGNVVTGAGGPVALALLAGTDGGILGGTTTVDAVGGVATFDGLTIDQIGSQERIQATSPGLAGVTTGDLSVTAASPARLVIAAQPPSSVTAGSGFGLGVSIEDAFGNPVTSYSGVVTASLGQGPAGSGLSGGTPIQAAQGVASFPDLSIDEAGAGDVIRVSADGVGTVSTVPFGVVAAAPSQFVIADQPPVWVTAGQTFGLTAAVEDAYGNVAMGYSGTVTASMAKGPAGGWLAGQVSAAAVDGIVTFSGLALDRAGGGYAIQASSSGLTAAASTTIAVVPAAPSRLVITVQPPGIVGVRRPFGLAVEAVDAFGNVATGFDGTVNAALTANRDRNTLDGTLSLTANNGQALVSDLMLSKPGKSDTLTITSSGLTPAVTSVFRVIRPAAVGNTAAVRRASRFHPRVRGRAPGQAATTPHQVTADHPGAHDRRSGHRRG